MNARSMARAWCPPALWDLARRLAGRDAPPPPRASWAAARDAASGYDSPEILRRVREATLRVKSGLAAYERDSVCFSEPAFRWPALACLVAIAAENGGRLEVVDFGGSLGSFYFQHRAFLSMLRSLSWAVVEQPHFVECGREEIAHGPLQFRPSLADCFEHGSADVVLVSGTLQYLEHPYETLDAIARSATRYLLVDRVPFVAGESDLPIVQQPPEWIYPASYPAWLLSRPRFDAWAARGGHRIVAEFESQIDRRPGVNHAGLLLRLATGAAQNEANQ